MEKRCISCFSGFTLIELLVVVLIIGILAAVALPQYQVAVMKSRTMSLLPLMKAIEEAEHVYRLANGGFTTDFTALDIEMPAGGSEEEETLSGGAYQNKLVYKDITCYLQDQNLPEDTYDKNDFISVVCSYNDDNAPILERYFLRSYWLCWDGNGEMANKVCKAISGKSSHNDTSRLKGKGYFF